jgi:hypothetical protein
MIVYKQKLDNAIRQIEIMFRLEEIRNQIDISKNHLVQRFNVSHLKTEQIHLINEIEKMKKNKTWIQRKPNNSYRNE